MTTVYLTRRNLLTLLSKLDRAQRGEATARTIIKHDTRHPVFPCSEEVKIVAVEDEMYYVGRKPGVVLAEDEPPPTQFNQGPR